ncbi:MAG: tetratricopeptide repeat protein [Candidatus Eisenbacteria bacterium]
MSRKRRGAVAPVLRSSTLTVGLTLAAFVPLANADATRALGQGASTPSWKELGDTFEASRLLPEATRIEALHSLEGSLEPLLRSEPDPGRRAAARFLWGRLRQAQGDRSAATEAFRAVADASGKGPFADDAAFAAIEAIEADGRDAEAWREWARWEKRFPSSPLLPSARLAQAWNALRRGEATEAGKLLAALSVSSPWLAGEARFTLARATALHLSGKNTEALALLGPHPEGAAGYLRALCLAQDGQLLKAAGAFQDVGERTGQSALADHARLAKANTFLAARDYRSACEEFARVAARATDPTVRAEAELRAAGAVFLAGRSDSALTMLRGVLERHDGTDVAARAQFLIGEVLVSRGHHEEAIVEYNRVLTRYFQHRVAAAAQYRVARCLDAMGRRADATGSYQAVVAGYPLEPEAPAAAYLAGVGLLQQNKPRAAIPYFQIVLDRYARRDGGGRVVFAAPEHQELTEAALCMLEYSGHVAGDLGQLSGAPHLLLQALPPSHSPWRAYALLVDADASAAQGRHAEAQATLEKLARDFPEHPVGAGATKLLAWTYARQGRDSLAVATEEKLLVRWGASGNESLVSSAFLDIAHSRFNQKRYAEAASAYEDFLHRWPAHPARFAAMYQAGLCYLRLDRAGDAVDRWEGLVRDSATVPLAERAWARAGDVYFQAERYEAAKRSYQGLLQHFAASPAAGLASLRLAQCEYNAGHDAVALEAFASTVEHYPGTAYAREAQKGTELALYRLSQQPDGGAVLAKLVEQYPTSAFAADALLQIARREYAQKHWAQAAEGFRQVVSRFPSYSAADQAQFLMADAYAHAGASADARAAYEQFLAYFPESDLASSAAFRVGLIRFEAHDYMAAAVAFTRALEDSAGRDVRSAARFDLALCQRALGDLPAARAELEKHRAEFPSGDHAAEVAFQLGDLDESADKYQEAARGFERALGLSPSRELAAEIGFRLGHCREQLHDGPGALRAYADAARDAPRAEPFRLSALARLAALHEERREYAQAVAAYRDIMQNAKDKELVAAAADRVSQLAPNTRRR